MNITERVDLITSIGCEIIGNDSINGISPLQKLLENKPTVIAYDGFEPSGRMHIAQGLLRAHNVNKFVKSGVHFKFWVADWFALMNLKLGGDINKIQKAGKDMIKVWEACGMDTKAIDNNGNPMIEFIWSSEEINKRSDEYWRLVLDIATKFNLNRIKKCTTIMGKKEEDNVFDTIIELNAEITQMFEENNIQELEKYKDSIMNKLKILLNTKLDDLAASQIFYPVMQCADIFFLNVDICSLGLDQRKVNMLAIEYCDKIKRRFKPIIISHHMLQGLDGSDKMSKSNPDNTIFMDDSENEIKRKIKRAFCEPNNISKNPLIDWIEHLILPIVGNINIATSLEELEIEINYTDIMEIKNNFLNGKIHPKALKDAVTKSIVGLLLPIQTKL
jgi:tyrosyl-tRNA synthetase